MVKSYVGGEVMKIFSLLSINNIITALIFFGMDWMTDYLSELFVLLGFITLLAGGVLSFIAIVKREKGALKFISLFSFIVLMILIVWLEPFNLVSSITWLKTLS